MVWQHALPHKNWAQGCPWCPCTPPPPSCPWCSRSCTHGHSIATALQVLKCDNLMDKVMWGKELHLKLLGTGGAGKLGLGQWDFGSASVTEPFIYHGPVLLSNSKLVAITFRFAAIWMFFKKIEDKCPLSGLNLISQACLLANLPPSPVPPYLLDPVFNLSALIHHSKRLWSGPPGVALGRQLNMLTTWPCS